MKRPEITPSADDKLTAAKSRLGYLGLIRYFMAAVFLVIGVILLPSGMKDAYSDTKVCGTDGEQ